MNHDQHHEDLATIGRNGIDRILELAKENERLRDYLRQAASTLRTVTLHHEQGIALPEWVIQDCRLGLVHIGAELRENTL